MSSFISKIQRRLNKHLPAIKTTSLILLAGVILFIFYSLSSPALNFFNNLLQGPSAAISITKNPVDSLRTTNDRTNVLLLGMGGEGHQGKLLTDSILLISYHYPSHKITLISIPRDIWVDSLKTKINATYYYGEQKKQGGGLTLAKSSVAEVTGLPVHYAFALDFEGFTKAVDLVGGIDVDVKNSFDDYKYPIPGMENAYPESTRYQHLHFDAGLQTMSGDRALKYVRSRNAQGEEGTDFARTRRQQQALLAFKDKLLSQKTLLKPQKISQLFDLYQKYITTDITQTGYAAFARLILIADTESIGSIPLITKSQDDKLGILEHPVNQAPYDGQWVLIPRDNNWQALHQYIQNQLNQ